jgi:hypothetical protein
MNASVLCAHGGQAVPSAPIPRVLVSEQPVVTIGAPETVAGCSFTTAPTGPCLTGQWVVPATRVFAMGQPVAILGGPGVCTPTGTPMTGVVVQPRVTAM